MSGVCIRSSCLHFLIEEQSVLFSNVNRAISSRTRMPSAARFIFASKIRCTEDILFMVGCNTCLCLYKYVTLVQRLKFLAFGKIQNEFHPRCHTSKQNAPKFFRDTTSLENVVKQLVPGRCCLLALVNSQRFSTMAYGLLVVRLFERSVKPNCILLN